MIESGFIFSPSPMVLGNDFTIKWDTSVGTNVTDVLITKPDLTSHRMVSFENSVVDLSHLETAGNLDQYGTYYFNITSCHTGNFLNSSTWSNCGSCYGWFNTTGQYYNCLSPVGYVPPVPPVPIVTGGSMNDIRADIWTPVLGEIINISAKITNNGTITQTYYWGMSVGKNYTGEWLYCNRDCYQDYDLYGDYRNVTLSPGETVMLTRSFKFRSGWFDVNRTYDLVMGIYSAPGLPPSSAIQYLRFPDAFQIVSQSSNLNAKIISFNVSARQVAVDYTGWIDILVMNNGTQNYDFYVGLSIGKNDTGVFCNRWCYADCGVYNDSYQGTALCDYGHTGTIHPGQTVVVRRSFKFDSAFFLPGLYDISIAVYSAPYLNPSYAFDRRMVIDYFNVTERPPCLIRSLQIYPLTDTIDQNQFVRFMWFTTYNCDGRIYWRDPGGVVNSRAATDAWNGTDHEYMLAGTSVNRPGVWTYWARSCASVTTPYMTASCETSANRTFTVTSEVGPINVMDPVRGAVSDTLGIPYEVTLAFIAMIIIIIVGSVLAWKTKFHIVPVVAMIILFLMFVLIGWIPWWILVLIVILAAFIVAKWGSNLFGGG
jgi:hypothetical protein